MLDADPFLSYLNPLDQTCEKSLPLPERADPECLPKFRGMRKHTPKRNRCSLLRLVPLIQLVQSPFSLPDLIPQRSDPGSKVFDVEVRRL